MCLFLFVAFLAHDKDGKLPELEARFNLIVTMMTMMMMMMMMTTMMMMMMPMTMMMMRAMTRMASCLNLGPDYAIHTQAQAPASAVVTLSNADKCMALQTDGIFVKSAQAKYYNMLLKQIISDGILKVFHIIVLFSSKVALRADDSLAKCANCYAFR